MSDRPAVAAVDWGTTRLRVWLLDAAGRSLAERRGDEGLVVAQAAGFQSILERHLAAMDAPGDLPVIVCGMAGSRQGWVEAAYVDVPAPIEAILAGATRVANGRRDIRIVPGLAQRLAFTHLADDGVARQCAGHFAELVPTHAVGHQPQPELGIPVIGVFVVLAPQADVSEVAEFDHRFVLSGRAP